MKLKLINVCNLTQKIQKDYLAKNVFKELLEKQFIFTKKLLLIMSMFLIV